MIRRWEFLALGGAAAFPRFAFGQKPSTLPVVAYLSPPEVSQRFDAFLQGMAEGGYFDGKNFTLVHVTAPTTNDLPALAAQIVITKPDVILTPTTAATQAVKNATITIPIVFTVVTDPIGSGV